MRMPHRTSFGDGDMRNQIDPISLENSQLIVRRADAEQRNLSGKEFAAKIDLLIGFAIKRYLNDFRLAARAKDVGNLVAIERQHRAWRTD